MKKLKYLLILLLILPAFVKADAGPPEISSYIVTVSNKDGAQCYTRDDNDNLVKTEKIYEYNTKLEVYRDISEEYFFVHLPDNNDDDWGSCMINIADFKVGEWNPSDKDHYADEEENEDKQMILFDDFPIYRGPSLGYGKTQTVIPKGTVLNYRYVDANYWYYVTYKGTTGWITTDQSPIINKGSVGIDNHFILYTVFDAKIKDEQGKVVGTIPEGTEITDYVQRDLPSNDGWSYGNSKYVYYKGIEGFIEEESFAYKNKVELTLLKDVNVYESSDKKIGTLPKGTVVKADYSLYNPGNFIIYLSDRKAFLQLGKCEETGCLDEEAYDSEKAVFSETVPKKTGFIKDMFDIKNIDPAPVYKTSSGSNGENNQTETNENEKTTNENKEESEKTTNEKAISNNQMIIYGVLGGIILFLLAVIILLLISRNNKQGEKGQKEEVDNKKTK